MSVARVSDLAGLHGQALADAQTDLFAAFLCDDVDIGLAPLQPAHVRAAIGVAFQFCKARNLKCWDPTLEHVQAFLHTFRGHSDDTMTRNAFMTIVAQCWYAWGVLTHTNANYGEHLVVLAFALGLKDRGGLDAAVLPYGRTWFEATLGGDAPMRDRYDAWVEQLRCDAEAMKAIACEGDAATHASMVQECVSRFERARTRSDARWFVEWLAASIPADLPPCLDRHEYTPFQRMCLRGARCV